MSQNIYENPFTLCTARDMSYAEVLAYWCNPFNSYKLNEKELFTSKTPVFIEGARGSGKTMILKYLSYFCQKDYANEDGQTNLINFFKTKGNIGIYLRYKEDFVNMFSSLSCNVDMKDLLFTYYYELLISRELITIISDMLNSTLDIYSNSITSLAKKLSSYFTMDFKDLSDVQKHINSQILSLDIWVKNSRYNENSEEDLVSMIQSGVISSLVKNITEEIVSLKDVLFIIIIDEYENAQQYQKNINTFIKRVDSSENITYRVGMRTEGIFTYETKQGSEFLQIDRDFLMKQLVFENINVYKKFLRLISEKRLLANNFFSSYKITDIEKLLGNKEDIVAEAASVVSNSSVGCQKHFELLKDRYIDDFKDVVSQLKYPENPLIEMLNILWVLRGVSVEKTSRQMHLYLNGELDRKSKYHRDYVDKYKYPLAFILLNIHNQKQKLKKQYYSFNTFAFLSSGSVNDFISLCRNTFYQLDNNYYDKIEEQPLIPFVHQTNGAAKTALEQLGKIKANNENGTQMYTFVMNLGNWFSQFHKDPYAKYPETNQFAFENDANIELHPLLKQNLKSLLKWGVLIKKQRIQSISIGRRKGSLYYLNHIFAPIFNISYRIRGGYNPVLSTELFEHMLFNTMEPKEIESFDKKNRKRINFETDVLPKVKNQENAEQLSLFWEVADDE